jgi:hypothetical protein
MLLRFMARFFIAGLTLAILLRKHSVKLFNSNGCSQDPYGGAWSAATFRRL